MRRLGQIIAEIILNASARIRKVFRKVFRRQAGFLRIRYAKFVPWLREFEAFPGQELSIELIPTAPNNKTAFLTISVDGKQTIRAKLGWSCQGIYIDSAALNGEPLTLDERNPLLVAHKCIDSASLIISGRVKKGRFLGMALGTSVELRVTQTNSRDIRDIFVDEDDVDHDIIDEERVHTRDVRACTLDFRGSNGLWGESGVCVEVIFNAYTLKPLCVYL